MKTILIAAVMMAMPGGAYAAKLFEPAVKALAGAGSVPAPVISKFYNESAGPVAPVKWVSINGGKLMMGTTTNDKTFGDSGPVREVDVKTFEMAKTAVTVAQYAECVAQGRCTEPAAGEHCNWGKIGRQLHPVNCVDWDQAQAYAKFEGARLPSEAEFEYAATSGGRTQKYPWGDEEANSELAVMDTYGTLPVCSRPGGNTAQGLCDMAGNVSQWVQDAYADSYSGAPVDGGAVEGPGSDRVVRGGSYLNFDARLLRAYYRNFFNPGRRYGSIGFRLARSR